MSLPVWLLRFGHRFQGHRAYLQGSDAAYPGWRLVVLLGVPFAALAFALGIVFELKYQTDIFDVVAYSLGVAALLSLELLLLRYPELLGSLVSAVIGLMSLFFLAKLVFLLFFTPAGTHTLAEMTETFFWAPVVYVVAFFIPGIRWGRFGVILFGVLTPAVSAAYVFSSAVQRTTTEPAVLYALIQLNLANVVMISLTRAFARLRSYLSRVENRSAALEQLAHTDTLTGLPNRLSLEATLKKALRAKKPFAVIFIDLDRFKRINDTQGHASGDELLVEVAQRLGRVIRPQDTLVRVSGDEFVLVMQGVTSENATHETAQKLQRTFHAPFEITRQNVRISASIGFCLYPEDGNDAKALLRHADSAMYRAKAAGRGSLHRFSAKDGDTEHLRDLEKDLGGAAERGEFDLVYQPLYSLESGQLVRVEALLRWHHPQRGAVSPDVFIPLAEESGQIVQIGNWVLQSACQTLAAWRRAGFGPIVMSVNISPVQLTQVGFFGEVATTLRANGLSGSDLELEITERTVLHNTEAVINVLQRLQETGVRIAMDDFGTGYSSLGYLKDLPLDTVKIDRSFVKDLAQPRLAPHYAVALVRAIASVAETLDLELVAEGVENEETARMLKQLGCHLAQGYFFARPLPEDEVRALLPLNRRGLVRVERKSALIN